MLNLREQYNFYTSSETYFDVNVFDTPADSKDHSNRFMNIHAAYSHVAAMKRKYPAARVSLETYQHSWICFTSPRPRPLDQPYRITLSDGSLRFFKSDNSAVMYVLGAILQPDQFQFEYHDGSSWHTWTSETNQTLNDLLIAFLS